MARCTRQRRHVADAEREPERRVGGSGTPVFLAPAARERIPARTLGRSPEMPAGSIARMNGKRASASACGRYPGAVGQRTAAAYVHSRSSTIIDRLSGDLFAEVASEELSDAPAEFFTSQGSIIGIGVNVQLALLQRNGPLIDLQPRKGCFMRADLRLSDLKSRERTTSRLMNVKIPAYVSDAIQEVARSLGASKTEVVIALLNEGLKVSQTALKDFRPAKAAGSSAVGHAARRGRPASTT